MSRSSARPRRARPVIPVAAWLVLVSLLVAALPASAGAQAAPGTAIVQLAGTDGCATQIEHDVDRGCARAGGLQDAQAVTLSPDQRFVYVVSGGTLHEGANGVVTTRRRSRRSARRSASTRPR